MILRGIFHSLYEAYTLIYELLEKTNKNIDILTTKLLNSLINELY